MDKEWKMTYLRIRQLAALQGSHVAAQPELFAMQSFQILFPLQYLRLDLMATVLVLHDALL